MDEKLDNVAPKRHLRWYQFSLRTLLIVVALLAAPCAYVAHEAKIVRDRKAGRAEAKQLFGSCVDSSSADPFREPIKVSWLRGLLGDVPVAYVELPQDTKIAVRQHFAILFPEATIVGFIEVKDMRGEIIHYWLGFRQPDKER